MQVLTFRHPKLIKDVSFTFGLIVFQPLLDAVLLHSLCCNTYRDNLPNGLFSLDVLNITFSLNHRVLHGQSQNDRMKVNLKDPPPL